MSKKTEQKTEETVETTEGQNAETFPCRLLRARWDENAVRHEKGTVVHLPAAAAMDAVEAGLVERVKDASSE